LDLQIWFLTVLVVFAASLTMSVAGFGFGLVATPLLFLFLEPKIVVLFSSSLGAIVGLLVFLHARQFALPKIIAILGLCSLIGLPLGILMLAEISGPVLKIIIGALVILFGLILSLGYSLKIDHEHLGSGISGFIGGVLMTGTGLGGPPVILFLINQDHDKQTFRANLGAYFFICGIASFVTLGFTETVSCNLLLITVTFIPFVIVAYFSGLKILPHIDQSLFRKIVITIVLLSGVSGIITAVFKLTN
jgi:uncharacterized protein